MTRLSNRQFPMLAMFASENEKFYMSMDEARAWDQRPFRSMLIQEWIVYQPGKGFHITHKGRLAWEEFQSTDVARKDPTGPLTAYFDPPAYQLKKARSA